MTISASWKAEVAAQLARRYMPDDEFTFGDSYDAVRAGLAEIFQLQSQLTLSAAIRQKLLDLE